ncbi:MAG: FHA domain-containing protein [Anaerolineae bacterium]|nr:FHA domain-containing protein [Anaerolineae bacterium]
MSDLQETLVSYFRVESDGRSSTITDILLSRPTYLIGSDARCALQLAGAQPVHAVVERKGEIHLIQPRYPNAEVLLNGKPVRGPAALQVGDQVQISSHTLVFGQELRALANAPLAIAPVVTTKPAVVRSQNLPAARPASTPVIAPTGTDVYFPRSADIQQGTNVAALALGAVTLLLIVIVVGFGVVSGTSASNQPSVAVNQFAFNDGNITMIMFDADW